MNRQELIRHHRTVLGLLSPSEDPLLYAGTLYSDVPLDVSPIARVFAETICDHHPELADGLARAVRNTAHHDPCDLAHALIRDLTIPEDSPAGNTLGLAFAYWGTGSAWKDERQRAGNAVTSAQLAAEAICVWARCALRPESPWLAHPSCRLNPVCLLAQAKEYLANRNEASHA